MAEPVIKPSVVDGCLCSNIKDLDEIPVGCISEKKCKIGDT